MTCTVNSCTLCVQTIIIYIVRTVVDMWFISIALKIWNKNRAVAPCICVNLTCSVKNGYNYFNFYKNSSLYSWTICLIFKRRYNNLILNVSFTNTAHLIQNHQQKLRYSNGRFQFICLLITISSTTSLEIHFIHFII
jgi:hypothetical protein